MKMGFPVSMIFGLVAGLVLFGCKTMEPPRFPEGFMGTDITSVKEVIVVPGDWCGGACDIDNTNRFVVEERLLVQELISDLVRDSGEPHRTIAAQPALCVVYYIGVDGRKALMVSVYSEYGELIVGERKLDGEDRSMEEYRPLGHLTRHAYGIAISRLLKARGFPSEIGQLLGPQDGSDCPEK